MEYLGYSDAVGWDICTYKDEGLTNRQIMDRLEDDYGKAVSHERRVRVWRERYEREHGIVRKTNHVNQYHEAVASQNIKTKYISVEYPDFDEYNDYPNIQEIFEQHIRQNFKKRQPVTIGIVCDEHLPDENPKAMKLAIELLNIAQPEIIVHNGDMIDLSAESRYPSSNAEKVKETLATAWRSHDAYWSELVYTPSKRIILGGNHNDRLPSAAGNSTANIGNAALREFKYRLEQRGLLFGGWGTHHLQYKRDLLIKHEGGTGVNAARANVLGQGHGFLLSIFAHAHKVQTSAQTSLAGEHVSIVSGCIANLNPSYKSDKSPENWQYGMTFVTLLGDDMTPLWESIKFAENGRKMSCSFGGKIVEVVS